MESYVLAIALHPEKNLNLERQKENVERAYKKLLTKVGGIPKTGNITEVKNGDISSLLGMVEALTVGWDKWKNLTYRKTPIPYSRYLEELTQDQFLKIRELSEEKNNGNMFLSGTLDEIGMASGYTWELRQMNDGGGLRVIDVKFPPDIRIDLIEGKKYSLCPDVKLENLEEYEKAIWGHIETSGFLIPIKNRKKIYGQAKRILVSAHIKEKSYV